MKMSDQNRKLTLSVVLPVYNEESSVAGLLRRVAESPCVNEMIIIDDFSADKSVSVVQDSIESLARDFPHIRTEFLQHEKNFGKGKALRTGFTHTTCDVVVVQDADLEYDPEEYPRLMKPILDGNADVVYGSRFLGGPHRVLYFWHYFGNKMLTLMSNMFSNLNLTDMETCYKMFRREVLNTIEFKSNRFGFEPEFTAKVAKAGFRIYEVPISYHGRTYEEGKKITWKDGVSAFFHILRFNLFK